MSTPIESIDANFRLRPHILLAIALPAMAAGMGWGIRGQYGHETGAMIAGVLTSLTLVLLFASHLSVLTSARAAALMTAAIGIGGSMTYGQTVGLTHDKELIGNWEALRWGMLGLATKGGIWIGFGGVFLGMGLGGKRYGLREIISVMAGLMLLYWLGVWLLNSPFDPANKVLPRIYFSDDWYFEPDAELKPRAEIWGGQLLAWAGLVAYAGFIRGDRLAWRLALWGFLAGAMGFPGGQCLQSFHSWNSEAFAASVVSKWTGYFNWWNMMETSFGMIWGGVMGLGLWCSQRLIPAESPPEKVSLTPSWEVALCVVHLFVLLSSDVHSKDMQADEILGWYTQNGIFMTIIPVAGILGGRLWPFLMVLPVAAAPIMQKSMKAFVYESDKLSLTDSWLFITTLPMAILFFAATEFISRSDQKLSARTFAAISLLLTCWLYFGLNTVFFDYAWPWREWSGRTPNQLIFMTCTACLSIYAVTSLCSKRIEPTTSRS